MARSADLGFRAKRAADLAFYLPASSRHYPWFLGLVWGYCGVGRRSAARWAFGHGPGTAIGPPGAKRSWQFLHCRPASMTRSVAGSTPVASMSRAANGPSCQSIPSGYAAIATPEPYGRCLRPARRCEANRTPPQQYGVRSVRVPSGIPSRWRLRSTRQRDRWRRRE